MHRKTTLLLASLLWLASTALLAQQKPERLPLEEKDIAGLLRTDHYGAYLMGKKVGWAKMSIQRRDGPQGSTYVSSMEMTMKMVAAGARSETKTIENEEFDAQPPYALRNATSYETDGKTVKEIRLTRTDKGFDVSIQQGGEETRKQIGPIDYTLADSQTPALWVRKPLKAGDKITVRTFDLDELKINLEVFTFKVTKETVADGIKVKYHELEVWIPKERMTGLLRLDQSGEQMLSMTVGGLFDMRVEPEAVAKKVEFGGDLFELGKVKVDRKLGNDSQISSLVLESVGKQELHLTSGPRQTVVRNESGAYTVKLGKDYGQSAKATAEEIADNLAETSDYPVGHAKIQALAKEAVADAKTPKDKVHRLVHFVFKYIRPSYRAEPLTVMDILRVRRGDCKHYARLLTTLSRAAGIPARDVSGLVYTGDEEKAFGLHAWNEVVLDGEWVPVDASADEIEINPTHINFGTVGDDQMANLYAAFSKLRFRVVEVKHAGAAAALEAAEWTASAVGVFISPAGDDANPGTADKPMKTLEQAQLAARKALAGGKPVRVLLRGGTYYLPSTLVFTPADSGTNQASVLWQAFDNEKPVISGGMKLELKWEPYKDGIMQAKVPPGFTTDQLFVNGQHQPMARYPNFDPNQQIYNGYAPDAFSPERAKRWADPRGGFIHAMHGYQWGGFHFLITGKKPDGTVSYEGGWQNNRPAGMHGTFRFVENIFEELDVPGEWFLDSRTNILYFYPPAGLDLNKATVEAVRLRHLVEFRGAEQAPIRFVTLKGLTFRHAARTFMDTKEPLLRSDWTTYRGGAIFCTGTEGCTLEDCFIDQVGGNAVFVNNYNRRMIVRGCHIAKAGANGVAFVGDRDAARVPRDWNDRSQTLENLDRTPGPKTNNYPADCLVEDCLIYLSGRVEKQTAPVQIELAQGITVRHCSLYDVPRAGINIGDGCWGGHVIEFCDVFDTVKETGDHGSFNSWGRDRFWGLSGLDLNDDKTWEKEKKLPRLDAVKTVILRNNRWRCDHGWDIDLDDGSTNYHIYNNLCLHGGLKNREGFFRVVENNVIVDNGFHPHVWYKHSNDIFRRNIMFKDHYLPAGGMPSTPWGRAMDDNLVHRPGVTPPKPASKLAEQSRRDEDSIVADAMFIEPAKGDFRVKDDSPARKLGFVNFPMDEFGVQKPELKAIARTPEIPSVTAPATDGDKATVVRPNYLWQARVRNISGLGDRSAYGLPGEFGVLLMDVPAGTLAAKAGLQKDDVVLGCNGKQVQTIKDLRELQDRAEGKKLAISVSRKQNLLSVDVADYPFAVVECQPSADFKTVPLAAPAAVLPAKVTAGEPGTANEPLIVLTDGQLAKNYGPVFDNGVVRGVYKLDLGAVKSIAQVNTFSHNHSGKRGRQRFVLYGSAAPADPGWNLENRQLFTPIIDLDTAKTPDVDFVATSVRASGGKPLGSCRWLVWAISPVTETAGGENTAMQEFQVIGASSGR